MTANESRYLSNLEKWKFLNAQAAEDLKNVVCKEISICHNADGKLNLVKNTNGVQEFFHSQTHPEKEALQWFLNLDVKNKNVIYVYGIGVGYYYDAIKHWLKEDKTRHLIFLEDNLEVIKCFLETEQAEILFNDPQVSIFYFAWDRAFWTFPYITSLFALAEIKLTVLDYYNKDAERLNELYSKLAYFHEGNTSTYAEFLNPNSVGFVSNYYTDLLELPISKQGYQMLNQFKGIPAIICGAGPSLEKNIDQLHALKDKALIMAGGTSMNVLNAAGIIPHFGVGIDPNATHYNRVIANAAFETPYFYRNRMYNPALKLIHGEKIFMKGAGGYSVPEWFEETLGLPKTDFIEEGHNVVNFNVAIAKMLGCNPILLVGVDLAYSNNSSYAPGLVSHALQDAKNLFVTRTQNEKLLIKNDIYGNPVQTLWKWVKESLWYSEFAAQNPQINILNCTEGGIGFKRILDIDLKNAAQVYLNKSYDIGSLIHGVLQNSLPAKEITDTDVVDTLKLFSKSLLQSLTLGKTILDNLKDKKQKLNEGLPIEDVESKLKEDIAAFNEEVGVKAFLNDYKQRFLEVSLPHYHYIECNPQFCTPQEAEILGLDLDMRIYSHLLTVAHTNIVLIARTLQVYAQYNQKINLKPLKRVLDLQAQFENERNLSKTQDEYSYENGLLVIKDAEANIDYKNPVSLTNEISSYPDKQVKMQQHRLDNLLHGPTTYYTENGNVLAQSWYLNNLKEGKSWSYYPDGTLYALKRFKKGLEDGRQEYYYPSGALKSVLNYTQGQLDGLVLLLHPNGRVKREMTFKNGKKEGLERMWNSDAFLLLEATYKDNNPVGIAREWHLSGKLAKEINYDEPVEELRIKTWTPEGSLIKRNPNKLDYIDNMTNTTQALNSALDYVFQTLVHFSPIIPDTPKDDQHSLQNDMIKLKEEMLKLDALSHKLTKARAMLDTKQSESIWKSPEIENKLREQMGNMCDQLNEAMDKARANMKIISDNVNKKISNDQKK